LNIKGKTAIVTGGASGLGLATVEEIVAAGGRALILDLVNSDGETKAKEIGDSVRFAAADVTSEEEVEAAVADGQIGQNAYAASKSGVAGMTLPLARDLSSAMIRVVTIAPGTFDTPMLALLPQESRDALAAAIPHPRRLGRAEEYAALVRHIIENPMLNGEVIRLDGALRMSPK
jgi:NAD(P)-dependent dehydrogenase (short-subunit alcohol dehydrogenase family)